jgi:rhodanese-related sulfurtransferase
MLMTALTVDEVHARLHQVLLVEALPEQHYAAEHLPTAVNVPGQLTAALAASIAPDVSVPVVVYCSGPACGRSKVVAEAFVALGYTDIAVFPGGKEQWAAAGLPFDGARARR